MPRQWSSGQPPVGQPFQLNRDSVQADGLVGWWPLLGLANSGRVPSLLGGANDAVPASGALAADPLMGLAFAVTTSYLNVADSPAVRLQGAMSLACWFNTTSAARQQGLLEQYDDGSSNPGYALRLNASGQVTAFTLAIGSLGTVSGATTVAVNTWQHGAMVYDKVNLVVYLNGVQDGTVADTASPAGAGQHPLRIGTRGNDADLSSSFSGLLGESRVYNRALAPAEVWQMWAPQTRWELYQPVRQRPGIVVAAAAPPPPPVVAGGGEMRRFGGRYL